MSRRRFKSYPAYKDSGVEWLGEIPAHWEVKGPKRLTRLRAGVAITAESIEETGEFPVFGGNGVRGFTSSFTHEGDFPLVGRQGALCGCVNFASGKFWASEHAVVAAPQADVLPHWLAYLLRAMSLNAHSESAAQPGLAVDTISALHVPAPGASEQCAIAAFLDRETARIDGLVAKKERLIELLQEKRTALITRTVTKGLDPNVPMKDSGVEWLGEIPAHWDITFLDKLVDPLRRITYGIVQPGEPDPDGILMVRGQNYSRGWSRPEDIFRVSSAIEAPYRRARLKPGDIVMTIVGAGTGNIAIVPDWLEGANLTQTTARIALDARKAGNHYFAYQLQSVVGTVSVELTVKGAAQPGLNLGHIAKYRVVVPSLAEQGRIADYLDRETSSFDALIAKVREAIARLKELRTALISAAVTGKIDVRKKAAA